LTRELTIPAALVAQRISMTLFLKLSRTLRLACPVWPACMKSILEALQVRESFVCEITSVEEGNRLSD